MNKIVKILFLISFLFLASCSLEGNVDSIEPTLPLSRHTATMVPTATVALEVTEAVVATTPVTADLLNTPTNEPSPTATEVPPTPTPEPSPTTAIPTEVPNPYVEYLGAERIDANNPIITNSDNFLEVVQAVQSYAKSMSNGEIGAIKLRNVVDDYARVIVIETEPSSGNEIVPIAYIRYSFNGSQDSIIDVNNQFSDEDYFDVISFRIQKPNENGNEFTILNLAVGGRVNNSHISLWLLPITPSDWEHPNLEELISFLKTSSYQLQVFKSVEEKLVTSSYYPGSAHYRNWLLSNLSIAETLSDINNNSLPMEIEQLIIPLSSVNEIESSFIDYEPSPTPQVESD